jgi:hypothetical protein
MTSLRKKLDARKAGINESDVPRKIDMSGVTTVLLLAEAMGMRVVTPDYSWDDLIDPLVYEKMLESSRYENEKFERLKRNREKKPEKKVKYSKARLKKNGYQDPSD